MGKRRRKQNGEERDKVNVSLVDNDNKEIKLSKTISTSYVAVSNGDSTNMKKTKSKKQMRKDEEVHNMPVDIESDKSIEKTSKKAKKKKHTVQEQETIKTKSQEKSIENNKSTKKKRNQTIVQDVSVIDESSSQESQPERDKVSKNDKKKQKLDIGHTYEDSQQTKSINVNNKQSNINKMDKKSIQKEVIQNEEINNDDEIKKPKKKKKRKIVEEEPINDEDIDKYCDELDPSYNKQYEDWVKLIEASLSSNTKVKK